MSKNLMEKESKLEEMVKQLEAIDEARSELHKQIKIKANEIFTERMVDIPATPATVCLYDRRHWTRSSEASPRYSEFWKTFSCLNPRWEMDTGKMVLVFTPRLSVMPERQESEINMFVPHLPKTHYEYVESCKGDIISLEGASFEIKGKTLSSAAKYRFYLLINEDGSGHIVRGLDKSEGYRIQEKTRAKRWFDLISWLRANQGVSE